jgi:hypothetical protein
VILACRIDESYYRYLVFDFEVPFDDDDDDQ